MKKLIDLGFDSRFVSQIDQVVNQADQSIARVSAVDRGSFMIRDEHREIPAELSGKFYFDVQSSVEMPCVGDWVTVQYHNADDLAIIHGVFPRRTELHRKRAGEAVDYQMIAANVDTAFIIQSCHFDFNLARLNRYLIMTAEGHVDAIIILTKTDLVTSAELEEQLSAIRSAGITNRVIALSNADGSGFDEFKQALKPGLTYCLLGSSGVGKTTLINRLMGREAYLTKEVSETGEGTHSTSRRQLIMLENGVMFIDTPGMREVGLLNTNDGVKDGFEDIINLAGSCRFGDCKHIHESGCAVLAAVKSGELSQDRFASFLKLRKESEHNELSYLEKRRKDKSFGRFIKTVKKNLKR
ncbi:MAG: ribosome small subunit-dependent GTPase A [Candidatus Marinimicrobia bacterium CG_4_9_14_3_um_filter_48_9]|nr:MAG: ribosome small subunit-dependent GTPase A [Candidatus Marinimicrobia bacterium CG_4_9_14_3_um_filter_48_9]